MRNFKYFDFHTHQNYNNKAVFFIQNKHPNESINQEYFSIGIHPWYISENFQSDLIDIQNKTILKNCLSIGEAGLDKFSKTDYKIQLNIFEKHIELSEDLRKPLTIHCVKYHNEIIRLKKSIKPKQQWVIHGFQNSEVIADSLIANNIMLSFGKIILAKNSKLQDLFNSLKKDQFFLETDSSSIDISHIYKKASLLKNMDELDLINSQNSNFKRVFSNYE